MTLLLDPELVSVDDRDQLDPQVPGAPTSPPWGEYSPHEYEPFCSCDDCGQERDDAASEYAELAAEYERSAGGR